MATSTSNAHDLLQAMPSSKKLASLNTSSCLRFRV
jgi:hypothetical protein